MTSIQSMIHVTLWFIDSGKFWILCLECIAYDSDLSLLLVCEHQLK